MRRTSPRRHRLAQGTVLGLLAAGALVASGVAVTRPSEPAAALPATPLAARPASSTGRAAGAMATPAPTQGPDAALVDGLRARFGRRVGSVRGQVALIEALVRLYREARPGDWQAAVLAALRAAFPERYEQLAARLAAWLDYERWVKENEADLRRLGPEEREANLWDVRRRLFGADADELWAAERRNQAAADALRRVDALPRATPAERAVRYREALEQVHGERTGAWLEQHRQEALDAVLSLPSVQQELSDLAPEARARQLREVRAAMGLDAAAQERWAVLDQVRDARWSAGERYAEARAALMREPPGAARDRRLEALRREVFGAEADTIAAEEAEGFFRYERARRWGRE